MMGIIVTTLKGVFRDRIFHGITVLAAFFLFIPYAASLSMRQVTELSTTLSFSLLSVILLLLATFLGVTTIWRDIERRYTFSVLTLPITRTEYLVGKFVGISIFMILASLLLGSMSLLVIKISSVLYPPMKPVAWGLIALCIFFDTLKYILLLSVAFLISTVSTSFFLPLFGTLSLYMAGNVTQQVYDYLNSPSSQNAVPVLVKYLAYIIYYLLPNLSGFDLKVNAIYSLPLPLSGVVLTLLYFFVYTAVMILLAAVVFEKREMK